MSGSIKTYVSRNFANQSVRAIKVTERNLVSVANWAAAADSQAIIGVSKTGDEYGHRVKIKTPKGWRVAWVGEYIVRRGTRKTGYTWTVGKDEFLKEFVVA